MKVLFNLTDSRCDLDRFSSRQELQELLEGFDGIELMHLEEDDRGLISEDMIIGYHITQPQYWLDFWRGDLLRCKEEWDTLENVEKYYHGLNPEALVRLIRREYETAVSYGAEYLVVHVSDAAVFEEISGKYHYSDHDVIEGFCEVLNEALPGDDGTHIREALPGDDGAHIREALPEKNAEQTGDLFIKNGNMHIREALPEKKDIQPLLLLENLWQPGLNFMDPRITEELMDHVKYPRKGIMLDTGHLLHTNPKLRNQKEGLQYIHQRLDEHGSLCRFIKGVHLNQSITGQVMNRYRKHPPVPAADYEGRMSQLFEYVFQVDKHRPFICEGVRELIERISPEYLTFEFISKNLAEHKQMLKRQQAVFDNPVRRIDRC